ncbi:MAG: dihydroxyacetone kinase subunit L [Anaerolineales bacterium]|nr:dihydroxyacetone kinase subunit L [Anaerolineales bacterium]
MVDSISKQQVIEWLYRAAQTLEENREYLVELDAEIGDADHGSNMDRGFKKVVSVLPAMADEDVGQILKGVGMALISSVGGASGPLYGTLFLRAGNTAIEKEALELSDLEMLLRAGVEGVMTLGKAQLEDKTMIDTLLPAVEALSIAEMEGQHLHAAIHAAVQAAEEGLRSTTAMVAKKGRASYLGDRSIGHQDPGATSSYLLLRALLEAAAVGEQ